MLDDVKNLQERAISELVQSLSEKDDVVFKAPTGSGKTFIMARVMDEVISKDDNVVFIVSSLSKANLAQQNYDKFNEYLELGLVQHLNPHLISSETYCESALYIPSVNNVYVLPQALYKAKSKLKGQQAFLKLLLEIKNHGRVLYLIKDESHVATNNLDELKSFFTKIINISATPKKKPDVEISEQDAVNACLIKRVQYCSSADYGDDDFSVDSLQYKELLKALDYLKECKKDYLEKSNINPCLIIQISNKDLGEKQFNVIERALGLSEYKDLKWVGYAKDPKVCQTNDQMIKTSPQKWEKYCKPNDSTIDVIIFKMAITEGWDIPRANMLFQIRDSKSKQLDVQVLGRVRRNPRIMDFEKITDEKERRLFTTAYVWGIKDNSSEQKSVDVTLKGSVPDGNRIKNEIQEEIKVKITKLADLNDTQSNFDIDTFLKEKQTPESCKSIFELYNELTKSSNRIQVECKRYMFSSYDDEYSKYFVFVNNLSEIKSKVKTILSSDSSSIEVVKNSLGKDLEVSLPYNSLYFQNKKYSLQDVKGVWNNGSDMREFTFDSDSEKKWLYKMLQDFSIKKISLDEEKDILLVGKNYLQNSEIKYEYYADGSHFSYPDFVLKDKYDRIFLFEVKSMNISSSLQIDTKVYQEKVEILKDLYSKVSSKVEHYFCLPILNGKSWTVHCYYKGVHYELKEDQFKNVVNDVNFDLSSFKS
ncbi:MAG TPA: DEAD/DEAH box helicase family protein [Succinivibrionaceae bacterium]|nr:DEAD/DEAH box helicase family protein [Succinivibrionaceae bacterium]